MYYNSTRIDFHEIPIAYTAECSSNFVNEVMFRNTNDFTLGCVETGTYILEGGVNFVHAHSDYHQFLCSIIYSYRKL